MDYERRYVGDADVIFTVSGGLARGIGAAYGRDDVRLLRNTPRKSTLETVDVIRFHGAEPVGVACIANRSGNATVGDLPLVSLVELDIPTFSEAECPQCAAGEPIQKLPTGTTTISGPEEPSWSASRKTVPARRLVDGTGTAAPLDGAPGGSFNSFAYT